LLCHRRPRFQPWRTGQGTAPQERCLSMAFGTQDSADEIMNEINMTPLVDVMLVLLIIFIITVPVMKHAVSVDLPSAVNQPELIKPETVRLSVAADGAYFWNGEAVEDTDLENRLRSEA